MSTATESIHYQTYLYRLMSDILVRDRMALVRRAEQPINIITMVAEERKDVEFIREQLECIENVLLGLPKDVDEKDNAHVRLKHNLEFLYEVVGVLPGIKQAVKRVLDLIYELEDKD